MSLEVRIKKSFSTFTLDVDVQAGNETLGFLGASGCGKSLTLRCIAGIETPDEGRIVVNDRVFFDSDQGINLTPQERKTALLFQSYMLFPNLTVAQNVAAGIGKDVEKAERERIVSEELRRFGLEGFEKRYPAQLSGGQQQRVALARMLAASPDILMLDEPFSALDAHLKTELEQSLLELFSSYEGTILYVSHDIDEAFRFCDRIAVVSNGHIEELSPKAELVRDPQSLAAIRLSGCKNTTPAQYRGDHRVDLPDWGVEMETTRTVPHDVAWLGVRAYYIKRVLPDSSLISAANTFEMRCDQVSDSRFERAVMASFVDNAGNPLPNAVSASCEGSVAKQHAEQTFFKTHVRWNIDKHMTADDELPVKGDLLHLHFPPDALYLATH